MAVESHAQSAFDRREVTRWCNSKNADSYRRMVCEGDSEAHFKAFSNLPNGQPPAVVRLLRPRMDHCRTRWKPDWHAIRLCAEDDLGAAMRLGGYSTPRETAIVAECLRRYGPGLTLVEACTNAALGR